MQTFSRIVCVMLALVLLSACNSGNRDQWATGSQAGLAQSDQSAPNQLSASELTATADNGDTPSQSDGSINDNSNEPGSDQTTDTTAEQPVVVPATVPAGTSSSVPGDITDLLLVTGQSNALGADTTFDAARDTPNSRVYAFTDKGWQIADLHQIWDLNWHPRNHPDTDPSNNFGFQFGKKVAERRPQKVVGFILVTAPGQGISHWDYGSEFYLKIRNKVTDAINQLPNKASVDGILWHQGETDWTANDYYRNKLRDVINNFRSESWFGSNKPFICGETVEAPVNEILMALNNDGDRYTGCVAAQDLSTILDDLHFSAEGLRILGTRYATKYLQMTEQ
jgi:hypothetical protein